jgi:hypothetical protein
MYELTAVNQANFHMNPTLIAKALARTEIEETLELPLQDQRLSSINLKCIPELLNKKSAVLYLKLQLYCPFS